MGVEGGCILMKARSCPVVIQGLVFQHQSLAYADGFNTGGQAQPHHPGLCLHKGKQRPDLP